MDKLALHTTMNRSMVQLLAVFSIAIAFFIFSHFKNLNIRQDNLSKHRKSNGLKEFEETENISRRKRYLNNLKMVLERRLKEIVTIKADHQELLENKEISPSLLCQAKQNSVVFIKTHKTGSSTVTNILNRFADIHQLPMLLPREGLNRFLWPALFIWKSVDSAYWNSTNHTANLLVNHARLNRTAMKRFFPEDVKFISLLRHPIKQVESTFHYQGFDKLFRKYGLNHTSNTSDMNSSTNFGEFFKSPKRYYWKALAHEESLPLLHNGMFFDLGYNFYNQSTYPDDKIYEAIKELEQDLHMVLITEHFDESLVLLMREFCWTFDDIIYIKHNQRVHKKENIIEKVNVRRRILNWNRADLLLYQHFNQTLWKRIRQQGDGFWTDFRFFKEKLKNFKMRCGFQASITKASRKKGAQVSDQRIGERVNSFDRPLCERVALTEIEYINRFRKQYKLERNKVGRKKLLMLRNTARKIRHKLEKNNVTSSSSVSRRKNLKEKWMNGYQRLSQKSGKTL